MKPENALGAPRASARPDSPATAASAPVAARKRPGRRYEEFPDALTPDERAAHLERLRSWLYGRHHCDCTTPLAVRWYAGRPLCAYCSRIMKPQAVPA